MTAYAPRPTEPTTSDAPTPYGWVIVATVFVMLAVTSGIGFYNALVILSAATDELGASVGSVSGATDSADSCCPDGWIPPTSAGSSPPAAS